MQAFLGCDAHKHYSVFVSVDERGRASQPVRIEHDQVAFRRYLQTLPRQTEIAVESTGNWYWIVDAMEQAGHRPHLANPIEAKKRMGKTHKTDALDAKGLAILLRNGTLPESWIPPGELRDQRELLRTRMALRDLRTSLKHRIHSAIDRYGLQATGISDLFGVKGRAYITEVGIRARQRVAAAVIAETAGQSRRGDRRRQAFPYRIVTDRRRACDRTANCLIDLNRIALGVVHSYRLVAVPVGFVAEIAVRIVAKGTHVRRSSLCPPSGCRAKIGGRRWARAFETKIVLVFLYLSSISKGLSSPTFASDDGRRLRRWAWEMCVTPSDRENLPTRIGRTLKKCIKCRCCSPSCSSECQTIGPVLLNMNCINC